MKRKSLRAFFWMILIGATCLGQTSFVGLQAGVSTRADAERAFGQPIKEVSETLFEYRSGKETEKIFVQYRKDSLVIERIEVVHSDIVERATLISSLRLPANSTASQPNAKGRLEEYFGAPGLVVLTYVDGTLGSGVTRVGYYSRELFESALGGLKDRPQPPIGGNVEQPKIKAGNEGWRKVFGLWRTQSDSVVEIREGDTGIEGVYVEVAETWAALVKPGDLCFKNGQSNGGVIEADWFTYADKGNYCSQSNRIGTRLGKGTIRVGRDGDTLTASRIVYTYGAFSCAWSNGTTLDSNWQRNK